MKFFEFEIIKFARLDQSKSSFSHDYYFCCQATAHEWQNVEQWTVLHCTEARLREEWAKLNRLTNHLAPLPERDGCPAFATSSVTKNLLF